MTREAGFSFLNSFCWDVRILSRHGVMETHTWHCSIRSYTQHRTTHKLGLVNIAHLPCKRIYLFLASLRVVYPSTSYNGSGYECHLVQFVIKRSQIQIHYMIWRNTCNLCVHCPWWSSWLTRFGLYSVEMLLDRAHRRKQRRAPVWNIDFEAGVFNGFVCPSAPRIQANGAQRKCAYNLLDSFSSALVINDWAAVWENALRSRPRTWTLVAYSWIKMFLKRGVRLSRLNKSTMSVTYSCSRISETRNSHYLEEKKKKRKMTLLCST